MSRPHLELDGVRYVLADRRFESAANIRQDSRRRRPRVGERCRCGRVRVHVDAIEEWPVRFVRNFLVVDGAVNGRPIGVLLDTGSTRSMMLHSAARRLNLPRQRARDYRMFGVGGESPVEAVTGRLPPGQERPQELATARRRRTGVRRGSTSFSARTSSMRRGRIRPGPRHGAYIPGEGLRRRIARLLGERRHGRSRDRGRLRHATADLVPVQVNGRAIEALLDSGAPFSILTKSEAAAVGLTPDTPGVVAVGKGRGIGPEIGRHVDRSDRHFTIGNENIRDTAILFGDVFKDATIRRREPRARQVAGTEQMLLGSTSCVRTGC